MKKYTHISDEERENIFELLLSGTLQKDMATILGRDAGTISRELSRNRSVMRGKNAKKEKTSEDYYYLPDTASNKARMRRKGIWPISPMKNSRVYTYVIDGLTVQWWSPDIISAMIQKDHPDDREMRISHEHIYQFIYSKAWEKLNLKSYLLRSHKKRKEKTWRSVRGTCKTRIPGRIDIEERPMIVMERKEFGHWEGDSVLSWIAAWAALHTELERKSRFFLVRKIPRKTALLTLEAQKSMFLPLPVLARLTTTLDNGTENVEHTKLTQSTWMTVYYAKPYHSWERGSNEHANWMLRRYFPKGTDFGAISNEEIQRVVDYINNRPRKILGYRTPKEVFEEEIHLLSIGN